MTEPTRRAPSTRRLAGPDDGSAAVETVILVPILLLVLLVAITVGRLESARLHVDAAAGSAARSASLARSPSGAQTAARAEAARALASAGMSCPHPQVAVDTAAFRPGGVVKVTVTCRADLGDLAGMGFVPIDTAISRTSVSQVDRYREAQP
jgi:Flp pilus assembly protein TadG